MPPKRPSRTDYSDALRIDTRWGVKVEVLKTLYRTQTFSRHFHDTFTIGLGLHGDGTIWYRGRNHNRRAGDVVFIPPGEVHTGGVRSGASFLSYMAVYLPPAVVAACAEIEGVTDVSTSDTPPVIEDRTIANALQGLHDVLWPMRALEETRSRAPDIVAAEGAIHMIVATLLRRQLKGSSESRSGVIGAAESALVRRVRELLEDGYWDHAQTSLQTIAQMVGVSPFHVVRTFTRATGLSPHHYLIQVRVNAARQFLASGEPPSTVAAMVGFVDQSHLTVHFKRYTGITPAHFQRCISTEPTHVNRR